MVPRSAVESYFFLPDTARLPRPDEMDDDEGLGNFRNVWPVEELSVDEVRRLLRWERASVQAIDEITDSPAEFDDLARVVDLWCAECDWDLSVEHPELPPVAFAVVEACIESPDRLMEGIDLGVTSLVAALASVGFVPAASCRGHHRDGAWSAVPVVVFAGERERVAALEPFVLAEECNLDDSGNGDCLVALHAPSVLAAMNLAEFVLEVAGAPSS